MGILNYIPHPKGERFDKVTVEVVERWKESELSGDEWRFSYEVVFWKNGLRLATCWGTSIEEALKRALSFFRTIEIEREDGAPKEDEFCCQPGCTNQWTRILHPINAYDKQGKEYANGYRPEEVRVFCEKHQHRGDCGLDDSDSNYIAIEVD